MTYHLRIWLIEKTKNNFNNVKKIHIFCYNYKKKCYLCLQLEGYCRQDKIIHKCTKLNDDSSNRN